MSNYQHVIETFTFIMGSKGVFDLRVNGDLIFSKHALGRHANEGEALGMFRDYVGQNVPTYP
jgi:predicted Rdx family selenoprotein